MEVGEQSCDEVVKEDPPKPEVEMVVRCLDLSCVYRRFDICEDERMKRSGWVFQTSRI